MTLKQKFKSAIKRGTGEAYILMIENPDVDFSNEIIIASLKNLSYDNQCENRAEYVFGLIELSKQKERIRQAILQALATEENDGWALSQVFDLAGMFAKQGDKEAREAIYKRFYNNPIETCQDFGEEIIIELDGMEGLKYIAEIKGKALQEEDTEFYWENHWLVTSFQEENPQINVYEELENSAKTNQYIRTYFDAVLRDREKSLKRSKREKFSYQVISERIKNNERVVIFGRRKKELSQKDIIKLADDFMKQTQKKKIETYLSIFEDIKYPYDYQLLLEYAKSENKKNRIAEYACGALKFFSGADIRQFALEKLNKIRVPYNYVDLLVKNYKKGDAKLLTDIIARCKNEDEIHSIVFGIIDIYEANKTRECKEPLEAIYDRLNCGIDRAIIVRILIRNKVISDKIKREIQFDSDESTRELYKKLSRRSA